MSMILFALVVACTCISQAADYARIEREVAVSDRAIADGQAALRDRVSLSDYADRVRRVDGREIWTEAFQAALDGHEIVVVPARAEKYWLDATVVVPSHRRIEATGATVALSPGVKTVMLRNEHVVDGTLAPVPSGSRDSDIAVVGGRWEDNCTSRAGYGRSGMFNTGPRQVGNYYGVSALFLFCNVDRFSVRDAMFVRCGGFAVQSAEGEGRLFRGIRFEDCFADGLHLNGNLTHVHAADVRGKVGDDLVALNAYDWLNSSICFGPQRFVLCEDLELELKDGRGYPAIRIQPAVYRYRDGSKVDCRISDVIFRRVKGITTYKMYLQTPAYTVGEAPEWGEVGSGGNLFFEDLDIDLDRPIDMLGEYAASQAPRGHFGAFEFGANLSDVTIRNVRIAFHADRWPLTHLLCVGPKSCTGLKADGGVTEYFDPYVSCTVGTVRVENLTVRGVPPRDLVHASSFSDVNGDGRSTGRGMVGTVKIGSGRVAGVVSVLDDADGPVREPREVNAKR